MEEFDAALLKERAALARNRVKLELGILSHPTHARIGEAYLAAIIESLPDPAGARLKKQGSRDKYDPERFKALVRQAYTPTKTTPAYDAPSSDPPLLWCPITRAWHDTLSMTTAHIVPYGIGEINAAYIFGLPADEGWTAIWSYQNGLLLHSRIKQAMDAAQLVIVPDVDSASSAATASTFPGRNGTKLSWRWEKFGALLENGRDAVLSEPLALELGDILRAKEFVEGNLDTEKCFDELSPKCERQ